MALRLWRPDLDSRLPTLSFTIVFSLPDHQVHDWLILFDREVEHIWRKEWNISKILFIISRYGLFLDMPMMIARKSEPYPSVSLGPGNAHMNFCCLVVHIAPYGAIDYVVSIVSMF